MLRRRSLKRPMTPSSKTRITTSSTCRRCSLKIRNSNLPLQNCKIRTNSRWIRISNYRKWRTNGMLLMENRKKARARRRNLLIVTRIRFYARNRLNFIGQSPTMRSITQIWPEPINDWNNVYRNWKINYKIVKKLGESSCKQRNFRWLTSRR